MAIPAAPLKLVPSKGAPVVVYKAGIEGGGLGARAIGSRVALEQASWQQNILINAGLHSWLYRHHVWVRAIVDRTAQACVADAYHIERADGEPLEPDDTRASALKTVLEGLNGGLPLTVLLKEMYRDLLVNGNAYARVMRAGKNGKGKPVALKRVDFRQIAPRLDTDTGQRDGYTLFKEGTFRLSGEDVDLRDIWHVQDGEGGDAGTGLSKLEALDSSLSLDISATAVNIGYMQNGAKAGNVYRFNPETMNEDQIERERQYLRDNFSKPSQSYAPMFLAGDIDLVSEGAAGKKDMDFAKLKEWTREEVASVYHMPLSLLSTAVIGSLGSNGKEQDLLMWNNDVVAPLQELMFLYVNDFILRGLLKVDDLVLVPPKNAALRLELMQIAQGMVTSGGTGNEARRVVNLPDIDGLDKPLYLKGAESVVGIPGDPDSILYTKAGAVSGDIQDPQSLASASAPPAQQALPQRQAPPEQVTSPTKKARPTVVGSPGATTRTVSGRPARDDVERVRAAYAAWAAESDADLWDSIEEPDDHGDGGSQ